MRRQRVSSDPKLEMYRMLYGAPQTELQKFRGLLEYRNRMGATLYGRRSCDKPLDEMSLLRALRRPSVAGTWEQDFLGATGYIKIHGRRIEVTESGNRLLMEMKR